MSKIMVILFHPDQEACEFAARAVRHEGNITVQQGTLEELAGTHIDRHSYLITAGNGFGLMDGGIDKAVEDTWPGFESGVRGAIARLYGAEMPVGTALCILHAPPRAENCPLLIYAPTMQVPMPIVGTDHVYLAARAALHSVSRCEAKKKGAASVFMPLLGTGTGRMPLDMALHQIIRGIHDGLKAYTADDLTWVHAMDMHARWHEMCGISEYPPQEVQDDGQEEKGRE